MAVYFVYRCYCGAPGELHVCRFEYDTVVDWVRSIWKPIPDDEKAHQYGREVLGGLDVWLLGCLFLGSEEEGLPPDNMGQVVDGLVRGYVEQENHGPHHLQILTEDYGNQVAIYLFDDHFRAMYAGLTDFLLLGGWELPGTWSDARLDSLPVVPQPRTSSTIPGDGEGTLYAISLFTDCKYNLDDLEGGLRIEGVRVPDLCRYILTHPADDTLEFELRSIRQTLQEFLAAPSGEDAGFLTEIRDHPGETVHWVVYSDWLQDRGLPPAGLYLLEAALRANKPPGVEKTRDPALDLVKVTPHMAQACKHEGRWSDPDNTAPDSYFQWIYFDDRWVAANPTIATGLLRFAERWDVLSPRQQADAE